MSDWNPRMVTPDGMEIEPSDEYAGTHHDEKPSERRYREDRANYDQLDVPTVNELKAKSDPVAPEDTHVRTRRSNVCPECLESYDSPGEQQDCIRKHARREADKLQRLADMGHDIVERGPL